MIRQYDLTIKVSSLVPLERSAFDLGACGTLDKAPKLSLAIYNYFYSFVRRYVLNLAYVPHPEHDLHHKIHRLWGRLGLICRNAFGSHQDRFSLLFLHDKPRFFRDCVNEILEHTSPH